MRWRRQESSGRRRQSRRSFCRAVDQSHHTASNAEGIDCIREWIESEQSGLLFANLVDFDQLYGHRNDVAGFYNSLGSSTSRCPHSSPALSEDDLLFITADHGNDPTTISTDHAREQVPLARHRASGPPGRSRRPPDFFRSRRNRRGLAWCLIPRGRGVVSFRVDRRERAGKSDEQRRTAARRSLRRDGKCLRAVLALSGGCGSPGRSTGEIVAGCNVENAAYGEALCAERVAVAAAVARGMRDSTRSRSRASRRIRAPPCGSCRQTMSEFAPDLKVTSYSRNGKTIDWRLSDLLPEAFALNHLRGKE